MFKNFPFKLRKTHGKESQYATGEVAAIEGDAHEIFESFLYSSTWASSDSMLK